MKLLICKRLILILFTALGSYVGFLIDPSLSIQALLCAGCGAGFGQWLASKV
jgi:hypothetical protein